MVNNGEWVFVLQLTSHGLRLTASVSCLEPSTFNLKPITNYVSIAVCLSFAFSCSLLLTPYSSLLQMVNFLLQYPLFMVINTGKWEGLLVLPSKGE